MFFIYYLVSKGAFSFLLSLELEATTFSIIRGEFHRECEAAAGIAAAAMPFSQDDNHTADFDSARITCYNMI